MSYSYLGVLYGRNPLRACATALLYSFSTLLDVFVHLNMYLSLIAWQPALNTTMYRMQHSSAFWWIILFNLLPCLFLVFLPQNKLMSGLNCWLCAGAVIFILNLFMWALFPMATWVIVCLCLFQLHRHNALLLQQRY